MYFILSIVTFYICVGVGAALSRFEYFDYLNNRPNRHGNLDGLRGLLALMVFMHHFAITFHWKTEGVWKNPPEVFFRNFGKVGVVMFFMITGYLFVGKIISTKEGVNWARLYRNRFYRIMPLYIFSLSCLTCIVFYNSSFNFHSSASELFFEYLRWFVFIGGDINGYDQTDEIFAGVYWTLRYEWFFYFSLPVIYYIVRNKSKNINLYLFLFSLTVSIILLQKPIGIWYISSKYFIYFSIGGLAAILQWFWETPSKRVVSFRESLLTGSLFLVCMFYPNSLGLVHILFITAFFLLVVRGFDFFGILKYRGAIFLGEISYSLYLLHGLILFTLFTQLQLFDFANMTEQTYMLTLPLIAVFLVCGSCFTFITVEARYILPVKDR